MDSIAYIVSMDGGMMRRVDDSDKQQLGSRIMMGDTSFVLPFTFEIRTLYENSLSNIEVGAFDGLGSLTYL